MMISLTKLNNGAVTVILSFVLPQKVQGIIINDTARCNGFLYYLQRRRLV